MTRIGLAATGGSLVLALVTVAMWGAGGTTGTASPATAPDGAALFVAKGCASCHDGPETTARLGGAFPSLADAATWAGTRRAGTSGRDYLVEAIAAPDAFTAPAFRPSGPTTGMPTLTLTSEEIDALVDHLLG